MMTKLSIIGIQQMAISQQMIKMSVLDMNYNKTINLRLQPHLPGAMTRKVSL